MIGRRRRRCSSALFVLCSAANSAAKASSYATDETNDGIITYSEYKRQNAAVDAIKANANSNTNNPNAFLELCDGYPNPFTEAAFITLYGPGAEEPFEPRDGAIFLDILQETLNECTDPCIYIDEVEIAEDELQKIGVLDLDFDDGGAAVQGLSSARNVGGRGLEQLGDSEKEIDGVAEMEMDASIAVGGDHGDRQLQRRRKTKKRRIKKAVMRGRRKRIKNKDGRFLQQQSSSVSNSNAIEPVVPADNNCGTILMEKLAATGNPAFTCLFSRGAFISSCDPRAVPLLLEDEELIDRSKRNRNANARELAEEGGIVMPTNDSSVEILEMANATYSASFSKLAPAAEVDSM